MTSERLTSEARPDAPARGDFADELLDELVPDEVDWRRLVTSYPVAGQSGGQHVTQLVLVAGSHHHHFGNHSQIGVIENPMMGGTVLPHNTATINGEYHGQLLQSHVVNDLVQGTL